MKKTRRKWHKTEEATIHQIAQTVVRLRREHGYTQENFAAKLGISQTMLSNYERAYCRINTEVVRKIAELLDVSADEILCLPKRSTGRSPISRQVLNRASSIEQLPSPTRQQILKAVDLLLKGHH